MQVQHALSLRHTHRAPGIVIRLPRARSRARILPLAPRRLSAFCCSASGSALHCAICAPGSPRSPPFEDGLARWGRAGILLLAIWLKAAQWRPCYPPDVQRAWPAVLWWLSGPRPRDCCRCASGASEFYLRTPFQSCPFLWCSGAAHGNRPAGAERLCALARGSGLAVIFLPSLGGELSFLIFFFSPPPRVVLRVLRPVARSRLIAAFVH